MTGAAWGLWLGAAAGVLLLVTLATARRPEAAGVADLDGYFDGWRDTHGGYDPRTGSRWVRGWLRVVYVVARPLARRGVQPNVVTAWTVLLAAGAVPAAATGGRWLLVGALAVVACGLADSLDGGVAVLTDRATAWGYVLDSVVDRITDLAFVVAIVIAGAPPELGVGCGAGVLLLEYLRARGGNAGAGEIGAVTVGERANRVVFGAATLGLAGLFPASGVTIATIGLWVLGALTLGGFVQLTVAVHRRLSV